MGEGRREETDGNRCLEVNRHAVLPSAVNPPLDERTSDALALSLWGDVEQ